MLEKYEKELAKTEDAVMEDWTPTLKDILNDKEKSSLFGDLLKRDGDIELATRLANAELSENDISELEVRRSIFNETMERAELVQNSITVENLQAFAKNDPDFAEVLKLLGPESAVNIYKKQIASFSISNPGQFHNLATATENYDHYLNTDWKYLDEDVEERLQRHSINESSFAKAIAIEDEEERAGALRGAVREGYNWFQKAGDWVSAGGLSKKRVSLMEGTKEDIDAERAILQKYRGNVGAMLGASADQSAVIRKALSQELIGDKIQTPPTEGFKEMKNSIPNKEGFVTAWNAYKKQIQGWDALPDPDKEEARNRLVQAQQGTMNSKSKEGGLWSDLFGGIFEIFSSSNRSELL